MSVPFSDISISAERMQAYDATAVNNFREYLRIPSVHPNINYDDCVTFLKKQAESLGLPCKVYYPVPRNPVVVITWEGTDPKLPSILLNSHSDVVPVFEEKWTYKPFSAHMDETGKIFARGSQDMKCVAIQYLEAIRRLKENGVTLSRTIHCSFVPDEETGGKLGMLAFVKTKEFKDLKVGFALDEGMASESGVYSVFYGERCIWHIVFHCPGQPGHGSLLLDNTAGEKVRYLMDKIYDAREKEKLKLEKDPQLTIGDVMTLNVTILNGGVQANVVPPEFTIMLDCRIPVTTNVDKLLETMNQWCKESGKGVYIEKDQFEPQIKPTVIDNTNPFWVAFKETTDSLNMKIKTMIFPGGTDSRFVRELGIPAIGFSPMINTPVLLHDTDEYLEKSVFLKGIDIYCRIIPAVANV